MAEDGSFTMSKHSDTYTHYGFVPSARRMRGVNARGRAQRGRRGVWRSRDDREPALPCARPGARQRPLSLAKAEAIAVVPAAGSGRRGACWPRVGAS